MMELGAEARRLLAAGRGALKPTGADRERVFQALQARIGAGATGGGASPSAAHAGGSAWATLPAVIAGFGIVGALVFTLPSRPEVTVPPAPRAVAAPTPVAVLPTANVPETPPAIAPAPAAPEEHPRSARRPSDRLAEEVAILSRAEKDLHAGRFGSALRALGEHQSRFPNGALSQERLAARVHVLCAMGRTSEAEAELARLRRLSPKSPHADRAGDACAATPKQ